VSKTRIPSVLQVERGVQHKFRGLPVGVRTKTLVSDLELMEVEVILKHDNCRDWLSVFHCRDELNLTRNLKCLFS
jgi:hypothetical protein